MSAMVGGVLEAELLVEYNGQKFRLNDLVDVIVGTGPGVRGFKAEPLKARFKGVVETVRGPEFLCRIQWADRLVEEYNGQKCKV